METITIEEFCENSEEIIRRIEKGEKIALTDGEVSAVLLPSDEYYYELYNRGRGSELYTLDN